MKVKLERTVIDHATHQRYNIYLQEDGKYFILSTPTNPWDATAENVLEVTVDTYEEAVALASRSPS